MKKLSIFLLIFSIILTSVTPAYSWSRNARTATIQGRITNSVTNQAISGAAVRAGRYRVNTNASGKYVIKNVKVWFWGRVYRVRASAKGYYARSSWIYVRRGRTRTLNFRLTPRITTATIKGRITDRKTNKPISGVQIQARDWRNRHRYEASTNSSGNYVIKNVYTGFWRNIYILTAKKKGYRTQRRWRYVRAGRTCTINFRLVPTVTDSIPPTISDISPENNALINNDQPEISAVLSDATSGIDKGTIVLKLDDAEVTASYDETTVKISYTPSTALEDGTHAISIEVKDRVGNEANASSTFRVETDTTPPVITNIQPKDGSETTEIRPTISVKYSDDKSGIDKTTAKILVGNIDRTSYATITETGISYKPAEDLFYGVIGVHIEVKDKAGNLAQVDYEFTIRDYVQELEDAVNEGDWDKICESADKIMKEGGKLVDELIEAAKDETKESVLRSMYLEIIGEIEDSKAVDSLITVVKDDLEDSEIRANAAYSLGKIGDSRAIQPLLDELDNEDTNIRSTISLALGLLNAPEAIAPLLDQLNNSNDLTERIRAGNSLASMKAQQAYDSFISILTSDEDESIRLLSALWLGELGDIQAVPSLIITLKDENSYVACNAAIALGMLKDTSAVQALIEALEDEGLLRIDTAEALAEIGDQSAAQAIADVIETEKDTWGLKKLKEAYKKLTGHEYEE